MGLMGDVDSFQGEGGDVGRSLPLLVVLVFGAVFEDAGELCVVEVALLVDGRLAEQLVHLLVREAVSHGGQQLPQVVLVDHTYRTQETREDVAEKATRSLRTSPATHRSPPRQSRRRRCG